MFLCFTLFFIQSLCETVLIKSHPSNTVITSPSGQSVGISSWNTGQLPNYLENGAQWIFQAGGDSWPNNYEAKFEAQFYADCLKSTKLKIAADDIAKITLNGQTAGACGGLDWKTIYTIDLFIVCGINKLTFEVTNIGGHSGFIFAVIQDQ